MTSVKIGSLKSSDPTISLPYEIQFSDRGVTASHADSGDVTYPSLGDLCAAYLLDQDEVETVLWAGRGPCCADYAKICKGVGKCWRTACDETLEETSGREPSVVAQVESRIAQRKADRSGASPLRIRE